MGRKCQNKRHTLAKIKTGTIKLFKRRISTAAAVLVLACGIGAWTLIIRPINDYETAQKLMGSGRYSEAAEAFEALGDYRDSAEKAEDARRECRLLAAYQDAQVLMA